MLRRRQHPLLQADKLPTEFRNPPTARPHPFWQTCLHVRGSLQPAVRMEIKTMRQSVCSPVAAGDSNDARPCRLRTRRARHLRNAKRLFAFATSLLAALITIEAGSLELVSDTGLSLILKAEPHALYGIESSSDLDRWTNWVVRRTDMSGRLKLEVVNPPKALFFRATGQTQPEASDPAEVALGERLFLETRFAEFFRSHSDGDMNRPLASGDPVLDTTFMRELSVPGAFQGKSMNCRACHLVNEHTDILGNRTYADYADRSPIPHREDGRTFTTRNSPSLVNASLERSVPFLLHFDGEFPDGPSLVKGTFTGRNFGWLPGEKQQALQHIVQVLRDDNGTDSLGIEFGGSYRRVLGGVDPEIPVELRLPETFRVDMDKASDAKLLDSIARLVDAYLGQLRFSTDADGVFDGSPYDRFLSQNSLPRKWQPGQTSSQYAGQLLQLIDSKEEWLWVDGSAGAFSTHNQDFRFGKEELEGLKIFLKTPNASGSPTSTRGIGNCVACHAPPAFTDFRFHNTGASQVEYDRVHGSGSFALLPVPTLGERLAHPENFLPATPQHPSATGRFASAPSLADPRAADLGAWNVFGNPDFPGVQSSLLIALNMGSEPQDPDSRLARTIAVFKTPGLRDLGHSAPYLHTGHLDTLDRVVRFYAEVSVLGREGKVRNSDPELPLIQLMPQDIEPLAAFLRSLNEDYE